MPPPAKRACTSSPDVECLSPTQSIVPVWFHGGCYNPIRVEEQHRLCDELHLHFVCDNGCSLGGADVPLGHPTSIHHIRGDGNCLFRALCYAITGSERQHFRLRNAIVRRMRCTEACTSLIGGYITDLTIQQYIERTQMDRNYVWGSQNELLAFAHMTGVNIASYNTIDRQYSYFKPGVIDINAFPDDNSRPTIYLEYTGNHFNVVLSQD